MKGNKIICDKCDEEIQINIQTQFLGKDIERVYFECQYCNHQYTSYYSSPKIKRKQAKLRKMVKALDKRFGADDATEKELRRKQRAIDSLRQEIGRDMEKLKGRYFQYKTEPWVRVE